MTYEEFDALLAMPLADQLAALEQARASLDKAAKLYATTRSNEEEYERQLSAFVSMTAGFMSRLKGYGPRLWNLGLAALHINTLICDPEQAEGETLPPITEEWIPRITRVSRMGEDQMERLRELSFSELLQEVEGLRLELDGLMKAVVAGEITDTDEMTVLIGDFSIVNLRAIKAAPKDLRRKLQRQGNMAVSRGRRVLFAAKEGNEALAELAEGMPRMSDDWIYPVQESE